MSVRVLTTTLVLSLVGIASAAPKDEPSLRFDVQSVKSGNWSDAKTWSPRVPKKGDRVLVRRGHAVEYDVSSEDALRMVQIVGTLRFARDRDTLLNVGILKVQMSEDCSESGFACEFGHGLDGPGHTHKSMPSLEVGTAENPIPAKYRAKIRLHYFEGMNKDDAPAIACCSAKMELHGSPLNPTWLKLGADGKPGDKTVSLSAKVEAWKPGDEILITAGGRYRSESETRKLDRIDGTTLHLDEPLEHSHLGTGDLRSEVANLSRNVIVESADPNGVRGHTVYHRFSKGGISYARFAHLGKKSTLGRYPIHYHLVGDTMRGSSVLGVAIVDSHNRWVTIHNTNYLLVRDCVGYQSVGHGYFLEDGTEVFNLLDHNLGVQARDGERLPKQALPFDPNDGAAFWWANARNSLVRNSACENEHYGYRYDSQKRSNFDSNLQVQGPDGTEKSVDIRTLPVYRFDSNETHNEGLYGVAFAGTDGVGPDTRHPHILKNLKIWDGHYGLRSQVPTMQIEDVTIERCVYGIYRPWFENHVYRNLRIIDTNSEPFNRGLDDRSLQHGSITVDGLTFGGVRNGGIPLIQISANNATGKAESHFRNVKVESRSDRDRRALVNLGGGPRLTPKTPKGVPIYLHDWYGPGRHAKVVSTRAKDLLNDGSSYREDRPLTGDESRVAEVSDVKFPKLLDPVDDLPPATIVTSVRQSKEGLIVEGVTHDNGEIATVTVNGVKATPTTTGAGVVDWRARISKPKDGKVTAMATDRAGNREVNGHVVK